MLKAEFEFVLKDKIEYAVGGQTKVATNLTIKAPSYSDTKKVFKLHSIYRQSVLSYLEKTNDSKKESNEVSEKVTHEEEVSGIVGILLNSDCDSDKMLDIFNDLILKAGKLDDKESLTPFILAKLSPPETLRLLGEYLVNFPIAV